MKARFLAICSAVFTFCTFSALPVAAQKYPFPQFIKYPYGFATSKMDYVHLTAEYERWKSELVSTCNGGGNKMMVQTDQGSKVEAVGFGMLIAAFMGDKEVFDGIYNFYKANLSTSNACGMMGWIGQCDGNSNSSAADGDIEVAFALIVASWQWPDEDYEEKAKPIIKLLEKVVVTCNGVKALAMGCSGTGSPYGGCNETDISYYNPAAFRLFAKLTGNDLWEQLADDTYTILEAGANKTTGLVPERQSVSGTPAGGDYGNFKYDACRTPWRIAMDYVWNGNTKAKAWLKKVSDFAYGFGIKNIKEGFTLSGQALGQWHPMCFTGAFGIAAMANSQEMVDAFGEDMLPIHDTYWFTLSLTPLYLLLIMGHQWNNEMTPVSDPPDFTALRDNSERVVHWSRSGAALAVTGLSSGMKVLVTSLTGREVVGETVDGKQCSICTGTLENGCYVLSVIDRNGIVCKSGVVSVY